MPRRFRHFVTNVTDDDQRRARTTRIDQRHARIEAELAEMRSRHPPIGLRTLVREALRDNPLARWWRGLRG